MKLTNLHASNKQKQNKLSDISKKATKRIESAALVIESETECPDCGRVMMDTNADGLQMKACLSCRVALPSNEE